MFVVFYRSFDKLLYSVYVQYYRRHLRLLFRLFGFLLSTFVSSCLFVCLFVCDCCAWRMPCPKGSKAAPNTGGGPALKKPSHRPKLGSRWPF